MFLNHKEGVMAILVQLAISLRDDVGVVMSRLLEVSDKMLVVDGENSRLLGQKVEFQFELEGFHTALYGEAEVERVINPEFGRGRCFLRIVDIRSHQRALFREWLYELSQGGGTPRRPHAHLSSIISSTTTSRAERVREGERRLRLLDQARTGPQGTVSSLAMDSVGRNSLRDVLVAWDRKESARSAGATASARGRPRPTDESRRHGTSRDQQRRRRVEVRIARSAQPPFIVVRYNDPVRFSEHYWAHLHRGALQVRVYDHDVPAGIEIRLRLIMPNGAAVTCQGHVATVLPSWLGLALRLEDDDLLSLRFCAGPDLRRLQGRPGQATSTGEGKGGADV